MEEANVERACRTLPFTLFFWVVFVGAQLTHRHVEQGFTLNRAMDRLLNAKHTDPTDTTDEVTCSAARRLVNLHEEVHGSGFSTLPAVDADNDDGHERRLASSSTIRLGGLAGSTGIEIDNVQNVQSPNSILDWVDETPIRVTWLERNWNNSRSYVSHFNRVIGGIRLMQARLPSKDCPGSDDLVDYYGRHCYDEADKAENTKLNVPGFRPMSSDGISNGRYVYWLDVSQTLEEALERTQFLRDFNWLDASTGNIEVQMALYNGETAMFVFARIIFTLDRTGYLAKKVLITSVTSSVYSWIASVVMDMMLLLCVAILFFGQAISIYARYKRGDGIRHALFRFQVLLNFAVCWVGGGLGSYFGYINIATKDAVDKLIAVPAAPTNILLLPDGDIAEWNARHDALNTVYDKIQRLGWFQEAAEVAVFWYVLLLVVKFFEAFSGIPRLAVITKTLQLASWDLVHFLLVFGIIFSSFSVGAFFLFGQKILEWSTPGLALNTSFRALMGDFDFVSMYNVAPVSATVWFWSYMMLIFLVMLNMLLAIIMDTYCEVKDQSKSNADILTAAKDVVAALRLRRAGVEHDKILEEVQASGQEVTEETLVSAGVPKGTAQHMLARMEASKGRNESSVEDSVTRTTSKQTTASRKGLAGDLSPVTSLKPPKANGAAGVHDSSRDVESSNNGRYDSEGMALPGAVPAHRHSNINGAQQPAQMQDMDQRLLAIESALAQFFNSERKVYILPEQLNGRAIDVAVGDMPTMAATR